MYAHRVEATLDREGALVLTNLPFHAGEAVGGNCDAPQQCG